jgi:hypothetical protein
MYLNDMVGMLALTPFDRHHSLSLLDEGHQVFDDRKLFGFSQFLDELERIDGLLERSERKDEVSYVSLGKLRLYLKIDFNGCF